MENENENENKNKSPLKAAFEKASGRMLELTETLEAEGIQAEVINQVMLIVLASRLTDKYFDFHIELLKEAKTLTEKHVKDPSDAIRAWHRLLSKRALSKSART